MAQKIRIPMQYKFILPSLVAAGAAFSWSVWILQTALTQDKLHFAADTNLAVLKSAIAESNAAFKLRFFELETFIPQLYRNANLHTKGDPFISLPTHLREELVQITFYKPRANGTFEEKRFANNTVLKGESAPEGIATGADREHPLDLESLEHEHDLRVINRSFRNKGGEAVLLYSMVLFGQAVDGNPRQTIIVADVQGDFALASLRRSELTEVFLLNKDGSVFANGSADLVADYAGKAWKHPAASLASDADSLATKLHWNFEGRGFTANMAPTAIPQVVAVSQTTDADLTQIFVLLKKKLALAMFGLWCAIAWFIVYVASRISRNVRAISAYLSDFVTGRQGGYPQIRTWDEVGELSEAVSRLAKEFPIQLAEAAQRGRRDSENALAQSLRTTLNAVPELISDTVAICTHRPEISNHVDFWDSFQEEHTLTLIFGRTNEAGVAGAMLTAYAKSCLATMRSTQRRIGGAALSLVQQAQTLNDSLFQGYKGRCQLLVTWLEIDLRTGDCQVINAGGEAPFCLSPVPESADKVISPDVHHPAQVLMNKDFSALGAALGSQASSVYQAIRGKLERGENLFLFTHNKWRPTDAKESAEGRDRIKNLLATAYHPTPQAMKLQVIARSPFGDEMTFWILEWQTALIQRPQFAA